MITIKRNKMKLEKKKKWNQGQQLLEQKSDLIII